MEYSKIDRFDIFVYQALREKENMMVLPSDIQSDFMLGVKKNVSKIARHEKIKQVEEYLDRKENVKFERIDKFNIILIEISLRYEKTRKAFLTANIYPMNSDYDVWEIFTYFTDDNKDLDFNTEIITKGIATVLTN